jgi:TatD DNase family protein
MAATMADLIDSHAHLDAPRLAAEEAAVLARAREAGVVAVVNAGADLPSSRAGIGLARREAMVFAAVGVHPHDADTVTEADWAELERLAADERVVAIGESGLDFFRDLSPRDVQRDVFARHLALADRLGLPVVIHCRDAYAEFLEVVRAERRPPVRGVLHCFQGDTATARAALDLGLRIGIGGSLTFPREEALRETVAALPLDGLLVETDAPYLTPRPKRGKNEPAYVRFVAERLAEVLGVPFEQVAEVTTANARGLFGLPL